jgi:hypothetical protein
MQSAAALHNMASGMPAMHLRQHRCDMRQALQRSRAMSQKRNSGTRCAKSKNLERQSIQFRNDCAVAHDPEKACPGLDPRVEPDFPKKIMLKQKARAG